MGEQVGRVLSDDVEYILTAIKRQRAYDEYDDVEHIELAIIDRGVTTTVELVKARIKSMDTKGWCNYSWGVY